ncbi:MAG: hypothetical protein A2Y80_03840 [Deltaproteobacteria bacterium RBG_13_58_19]|nr:MAG: hypothetical protein A2Y80_03840 [Deltaproteobacteria bacterium RBG_13_58_19]
MKRRKWLATVMALALAGTLTWAEVGFSQAQGGGPRCWNNQAGGQGRGQGYANNPNYAGNPGYCYYNQGQGNPRGAGMTGNPRGRRGRGNVNNPASPGSNPSEATQ